MGKQLVPHHLEGLQHSGLSDETIAALDFYWGTAAEIKITPGFDVGPGVAIPDPFVGGARPFWRRKPECLAEAMEKESDRQYPSRKEGKAQKG